MRRSAHEVFASPASTKERALCFLGCAAFYAIIGTVLASVIAWSIILFGVFGTMLVAMVTGAKADPGPWFDGTAVAAFGILSLFMVPAGAIGYVVAPFVGFWIGWLSALCISLAMATVWSSAKARRHALWLSLIIGAAAAFLVTRAPYPGPESGLMFAICVVSPAAVASALVTRIIQAWSDPDPVRA
jgi:hypothetical protein